MLPYQQRVITEKTELDDRITKLIEFVKSSMFTTLSVNEQNRLAHQLEYMTKYSEVLTDRIENFQNN